MAVPVRRVALLLPLVLLAGCGSPAPKHDAADVAFLQHMLPHHLAALEVGRLGLQQGADPRTRAFGQRVLDEQQPEVDRITAMAQDLGVDLDLREGMQDADDLIQPLAIVDLKRLSGRAFDQAFLLMSARSEEGAAAMARLELGSGTYAPARKLASSIAGAPYSEIPQLRALAAELAKAP